VRATWNGVVLAESDDTVVVEGNHYFPREAVVGRYVRDSDHRSICPWKGVAAYLTLEAEGRTNPDAAWYYPRPSPLARRIKGRVAFGRGVQVE
jgi:uncharacterized protein (DUF427 family)